MFSDIFKFATILPVTTWKLFTAFIWIILVKESSSELTTETQFQEESSPIDWFQFKVSEVPKLSKYLETNLALCAA